MRFSPQLLAYFIFVFCSLNGEDESADSHTIAIENTELSNVMAVESPFVLRSISGSTKSNDESTRLAPLEAFNREPSSFINGSVNAITGDYHETQTDLIIPGPEPLVYQRSYVSSFNGIGSLSCGWNIYHFGLIQFLDDHRSKAHCDVWDRGGGIAHFSGRISNSKSTILSISPEVLNKSITNSSSYELSGNRNIKNSSVTLTKHRDAANNEATFVLGDGTKRFYKRSFYTALTIFDMTREEHPNGNQLLYEYNKSKYDPRIEKVKLANKHNNKLSWLSISYTDQSQMTVTACDNRQVRYDFIRYEGSEKEHARYYLSKVIRPDSPEENYEYSNKQDGIYERLTKKSRPDNRYLINEYYQKGNNQVGGAAIVTLDAKDPRLGKVKQQKAPVGVDATPIITHRYFYNFPKGETTVWDALDNQTIYVFNGDQRLTQIKKYKGKTNPSKYTKEQFFWGANGTSDSTNLLSRCFREEHDWIQICRSFTYDTRGNVTQEKLWGDLSGHNEIPVILKENGVPEDNGCEHYTKNYEYSEDGRNLLMKESDFKTRIDYAYHSGSNLLKSKLTWADNRIQMREFYEYDANAVVILSIVDDGNTNERNNLSGVTERHITRTTPRTTMPIGLPHIVEEKYLDIATNQEILLKKIVNDYTSKGRHIQQDHYDANDELIYSLTWSHDAMGNVEMETDAMGNVINRKFDANGNCKYEQGPRTDYSTEYTYDCMNRLTRIVETHVDRVVLTSSFAYDYLGNKVASVDSYGNETRYEYDELGRLVKTIMPSVLNEDGNSYNPTSETDYTALNYPKKIVDANGAVTYMEYNLRGKPKKITYPDGTVEVFKYNLDGTLYRSISRTQLVTEYLYDPFERIVETKLYASSGELIGTTSATYNAFHITSQTDLSGRTTTYEYDGAGRKIVETQGDSTTTFAYDARGRLEKTKEYYGNGSDDYIAKCQKYDDLDRVKKDWTEDSQGNVLTKTECTYDESSNKTSVTIFTQSGEGTTVTKYDSRGVPECTIDAADNVTTTEMFYNYHNQLGQIVPYSEITDPMGNVTAIEKDALGRVVRMTRKDSDDTIIQNRIMFYDPSGAIARTVETVITPNGADRQVETKWKYDPSGRLELLTEAVGTPEQKATQYTYNGYGQLETIVKPDGVTLYHTYDALGRLSTHRDSDGSFSYKYEYDLSNNPTQVTDLVNNTVTTKVYEPKNNRLSQEILGNGLSVSYNYDRLGRPTEVLLPDNSGIEYVYQSAHLKAVNRITSSKQELYSHLYKSYDQAGNVTSAQMIGQAGTLNYQIDTLGRVVQQTSQGYSEAIISYDSAGNICSSTLDDSRGHIDLTYTYDNLYQLKSEQGDTSHTYENDSLYNRTKKDGTAYTLNGLNQVKSDTSSTYRYNLAGDLITKTTGSYIIDYDYDALGRLTSVTDGITKYQYVYDSFNRRLSKTQLSYNSGTQTWQPQNTVRYLYLGQNEVGAVDAQDKITQFRMLGMGKGAEIGAAVAIEIDNKVYAPIHDRNGNVRCLINASSGSVEETYRYTAFGTETFYGGWGFSRSSAISPWRFSSKRVDEETGFVFFGRRYYNSELGRWATPDPMGFDAGPNLYAYVSNSPLTHIDLYGLWGESARGNDPRGIGPPDLQRKSRSPTSRDYLGKGIQNSVRAFGRSVEFIGRHCVGIPGVRDCFEYTGRFFAGRDMSRYTLSWNRRSSFNFDYGHGEISSKVRLTCVNGIMTDFSEYLEFVKKLSAAHGGVTVHATYIQKNGFVTDIADWFCQKVGIPTHSEQVLRENIQRQAADMGGADGGGEIWHHAHSKGAAVTEAVRPSLGSITNMMVVATYGGAAHASEKNYKSATNYVATMDWVSLAGPSLAGLLGARNDVVFLPSSSWIPIVDHAWDGPVYRGAYKDVGQDFQNKYGRLKP